MAPRSTSSLAARAATFAIILAWARGASAQVNVEALRRDLRETPAIATLEGSFTGRVGNVQAVIAGGAASGAARWKDHRFYASTSADYARFSGETRVSKSFVHFRYNYLLTGWLAGEAFAQEQHDQFQRLSLRALFGLGPRFTIADEETFRVACGTAWMIEHERINVAPGAPDAPEATAHRWSNYVSVTMAFDDRVRAVGTVYLQPRFDALTDARTLIEAAVTTDVTKRFALKLSATVRHDSDPPSFVKDTDAEVKNSIVLKF